MDCNFREPSLEARKLGYKVGIGAGKKETLVKYLEENEHIGILNDYARKGRIEYEIEEEEAEIETEGMSEEEILARSEKAAQEVKYELFLYLTRRLTEMNKSIGLKFDVMCAEIRILLVLERDSEAKVALQKTEHLMELGVDWGRKNKFKVYKGLLSMLEKDYRKAAELFLDALSTFEGEELLTYRELVHYSIFCGLLTLSRAEIGQKLMESSEVREVIGEIDGAGELVESFYECNYFQMFSYLVEFSESLLEDVNLRGTVDYFVYMMKVRAYNQLFTSYRAISLAQMSSIFRVRREYILRDIERMILREDLQCKISHSNMMVYNTPAETKDTLREQAEELSHTIQKIISSK